MVESSQSQAKYVARCFMINEDPSRRNMVAVIQKTDAGKFHLKVLKDNDATAFEVLLDKMPASWYLAKEDFLYQEDLASNKLTLVNFKFGEVNTVKEFQLPADIVIKKPISANLDTMIEKHPCEDKQALRDLISSEDGPIQLPEQMIFTCLRNRIYFVAEGGVYWFKPDSHKEQTTTLEMSNLIEVSGWKDNHRAIGVLMSQQSTGRQEFWVITENLKNKKLGLQLFWEDGEDADSIDIQIGSQNWNHKQEHPIVKMIYMRQKCNQESEDYPNRTIWKDKSMILLDAEGKVYKTHNLHGWHESIYKIHDNCIDIHIDEEKFYVKHLKNGADGGPPTVEIQSINVQDDEITDEAADLKWPTIMDKLGPLGYKFVTPSLVGGLYERSAEEWQMRDLWNKPAVGDVIARCDPVADLTKRKFFAAIYVAPDNKYSLKVQNFDGTVVYEQLYDFVIDSWVMTFDKFYYQEQHSNNKITYVKLPYDEAEQPEVEVKHFALPSWMVIKDRINASMEPFVQAHPSDDKQAIRNAISASQWLTKQPCDYMMASVDDKLAFLHEVMDDEGNSTGSQVYYFRPDKLIKSEESKDDTITLVKTNFQVIKGVPKGHNVFGMCAYLQKANEKTEIVTFSEDLDNQQFGLQIFWEDGKTIDIKHGSAGWKWEQNDRIVKILYLNRRDEDETRNYTTRDLWKDKKLIMLDAAGQTYHLDGFWWHHAHKSLEDKCIDIAHDTQHFRQKHFLDDCKQEIRKVHSQTFKVTSVSDWKSDISEDWKHLLMSPLPNRGNSGNQDRGESAREFIGRIAKMTGQKNMTEAIIRLGQEDIETVDDLELLTDHDFKNLGFSVGFKCKVKRLLQEERNEWLLSDNDIREWFGEAEKRSRKNLDGCIEKLDGIDDVNDLYHLTDEDYKELGFSIGQKCQVQYWLAKRKALKK